VLRLCCALRGTLNVLICFILIRYDFEFDLFLNQFLLRRHWKFRS
jgi:hypothetical protein